MEEWRSIPGWQGYYEVSSLGRVRRTTPGKSTRVGFVLKSFADKRGYKTVQLSRDDNHHTLKLARLIASAFLPNFDESLQVDHINGQPSDNRLCNLRLVTLEQNAKNRRINRNSALGTKGVSLRKGYYIARIQVNKKRIGLGYFKSQAEAVAAYRGAELLHFGEFARGASDGAP